jgi:hypothetical protein
MRDYESAWGEFKGWDRTRRIELLSSLIDTFEGKCRPTEYWSGRIFVSPR